MVRINLPMDLLRSFVTIVDTGSMVKASEHVFLTQSALSLQMKRLADIMQQPMFRRQQGALLLTSAGETLLAHARDILALNDQAVTAIGGRLVGPIRIGMVQDFADAILAGVLARFKRLNPDLRMEIRISNSSELKELVENGLLDIALYLAEEADKATIAVAPMAWLGDEDLLAASSLPIAIMTKPCIFREASLAALEQVGQPYTIAVETPSISVLRAAVDSGFAITCRTTAFLGHSRKPLNIPDAVLPNVAYSLAISATPSAAIVTLADLLKVALGDL